MQDLDKTIHDRYFEFGNNNLTTPYSIYHAFLAKIFRLGHIDNHSLNTLSIAEIAENMDRLSVPICAYYLPEQNVILSTSSKAGSMSIETMLSLCDHTQLSTYSFLNLIESHNPEIWHIYRDPLVRFLSYFYYRGAQSFLESGVHWRWEGVDMNRGRDNHRRPQFSLIPGYFKDVDINKHIDLTIDSNPDLLERRFDKGVPHDQWAYKFLENFVPHNRVKFFWMYELTEDKKNVIEIFSDRLGINFMDINRPNRNLNTERPKFEDIPKEFIKKIWVAQTLEREFLSKLTWENGGPIQFKGEDCN